MPHRRPQFSEVLAARRAPDDHYAIQLNHVDERYRVPDSLSRLALRRRSKAFRSRLRRHRGFALGCPDRCRWARSHPESKPPMFPRKLSAMFHSPDLRASREPFTRFPTKTTLKQQLVAIADGSHPPMGALHAVVPHRPPLCGFSVLGAGRCFAATGSFRQAPKLSPFTIHDKALLTFLLTRTGTV